MKITLKSLHLKNFKGIRDLKIDFQERTDISGDNATGKTTIADAFFWLISGKDSTDRKEFNIKTLGPDNKPLPRLDHEVIGNFDMDGSDKTLRRVYKERWNTKRGSEEVIFNGHETTYFWNDVPLSQNEYSQKVNHIIDEKVLKLITNPMYFNGVMHWTDRRNILTEIAGEISDSDIMDKADKETDKEDKTDKIDYQILISAMREGKTIDEFKKEIYAKKKIIKDELILIPPRIDEVKNGMPEVQDWNSLDNSIEKKEAQIKLIDLQLNDVSVAHDKAYKDYEAQRMEWSSMKTQLATMDENNNNIALKKTGEIKASINNRTFEIEQFRNEVKSKSSSINLRSSDIQAKVALIETIISDNDKLKSQWRQKNAEVFEMDEGELKCPTCKRDYKEDESEDITTKFKENFNTSKSKNLKDIEQEGNANQDKKKSLEEAIKELASDKARVKLEIDDIEIKIEKLNLQVSELESKIKEQPALEPTEEYKALEAQIDAFVMPEAPKVDNVELNNKKTEIHTEIVATKIQLAKKSTIKQAEGRIKELEVQEKTLAQQLADYEKTEFSIAAFQKAKVELVTERINGLFNYVTFKMYDIQINGGFEETCEALVNGVPFSDLNNAARINAGLDVINVLCTHYDVSAPIFIDNRESVNNIVDCESQIVNLIVNKDPELKIQ